MTGYSVPEKEVKMNMELIMQYVTYVLMAVGLMAFVVSGITQVIKEMPFLVKLPTSAVALVVSMILCPLAVIIACQYFNIVIVWYYVFASFIAAFIVYLVATGGWERVTDIWNRTNIINDLRGGKPRFFMPAHRRGD